MRLASLRNRKAPRPGVALLWVLIIIALLSALVSATTVRTMAGRRLLVQRHAQLQSDWLARSGLEIAVARLLTNPAGYAGEKLEPIPLSRVHITVSREEEMTDTYLVTSEASYPTTSRVPVARRFTQRFQRKIEKGLVRIIALGAIQIAGP